MKFAFLVLNPKVNKNDNPIGRSINVKISTGIPQERKDQFRKMQYTEPLEKKQVKPEAIRH